MRMTFHKIPLIELPRVLCALVEAYAVRYLKLYSLRTYKLLCNMRNNKAVIIFISLILLLSQCGFATSCNSSNNKITAEKAKQIVTEEILSGKLNGKTVYMSKMPLKKGETIQAMAKTYHVDEFVSSWVFFIDDAPQANWEHPCRYVFVDEGTGKYMVIEGTTPPDNMNMFMKIYPHESQ